MCELLPLKLIAEVSPGRIHGLTPYLPWVAELADAVDIPESPLGEPHPSAIGVAAYLKGKYNMKVYPHVRIKDLNIIALASKAYLTKILGLDGLVLLRGEGSGKPCLSLTAEEAAEKIKSLKGLSGLRLGAILSLKFNSKKVLERGQNPNFSFYLIIRFSPSLPGELINALSKIRSIGKELYAYVLVASKLNKELVTGLGQYYVREDYVKELISKVEGLIDGVILSVPKDREGLKRILLNLRRK